MPVGLAPRVPVGGLFLSHLEIIAAADTADGTGHGVARDFAARANCAPGLIGLGLEGSVKRDRAFENGVALHIVDDADLNALNRARG